MPIKGLTENRRLPRLGKIHLGVMVEATEKRKAYPKAVDHFVFPKDGAVGAEQREALEAAFGPETRTLRVMFPLDDEDMIASQYYRCYSKTRGLVCKGDGETCRRMVDTTTGALANRNTEAVEWREMVCQGRDCPDYDARCKEMMCLQFMLPEIPGLGIWQIDTSSINSIRNINNNLEMLRAVYGRLAMMPLELALIQIEVTLAEDGKKKKVWVMNLTSPQTLQEAARLAMQKPLSLLAGVTVAMPVADDERPDLVTPDWENGTKTADQEFDEMSRAEMVENEGESNAGPWLQDEITEPLPSIAGDVAAGQTVIQEQIPLIGQRDPLPMTARPGAKLRIKETSQILVWVQTTSATGGWFTEKEAAGMEPVMEQPEKPPSGPDETIPTLGIDMDWVKESLKVIKWSAKTAISWLQGRNPDVNPTGTLAEVLGRLTTEQHQAFVKEVQDRLDMK